MDKDSEIRELHDRVSYLEQDVKDLMLRLASLEGRPIITDRPIQFFPIGGCTRCGTWHNEQIQRGQVVGDCSCDCHKVMC